MNPAPFTYRPDRTIADAEGVPLARCYADRNEAVNGPLFAAAPQLLEAAYDAKWVLEGLVEDEDLGDECPRPGGFDLCGANCCEHSGCAVERLARVRAAIALAAVTKATGDA